MLLAVGVTTAVDVAFVAEAGHAFHLLPVLLAGAAAEVARVVYASTICSDTPDDVHEEHAALCDPGHRYTGALRGGRRAGARARRPDTPVEQCVAQALGRGGVEAVEAEGGVAAAVRAAGPDRHAPQAEDAVLRVRGDVDRAHAVERDRPPAAAQQPAAELHLLGRRGSAAQHLVVRGGVIAATEIVGDLAAFQVFMAASGPI